VGVTDVCGRLSKKFSRIHQEKEGWKGEDATDISKRMETTRATTKKGAKTLGGTDGQMDQAGGENRSICCQEEKVPTVESRMHEQEDDTAKGMEKAQTDCTKKEKIKKKKKTKVARFRHGRMKGAHKGRNKPDAEWEGSSCTGDRG